MRAAYEEQCELVEAAGAQVVVMASRALAAAARGPDDYRDVYGIVLGGLGEPAIIHWLGEMFDPALAGYWGSTDLDEATEVHARHRGANADKVDGVKVSLLDARREVDIRRRLPEGVRLYTGDDFNYPELIAERQATRCSGSSTPSPRRRPRRCTRSTTATWTATAASSSRPSRSRTGCSSRRPSTTRPASSSSPTCAVTRTTSACSPAWRARVIVHLADLFVLADRAGLLPDPALARRAHAPRARAVGDRVIDPARLSLNLMTVDH